MSKLAHSASRVAPPDLEPETLDEPHDAELAEVRESLPATGRNVVFVLDTSPGMRPYQEEARSEVLGRIARLGPLDRFNLIAAGREAAPFARESVPPDAGTIIALRIWMDSLAASDGSDITAGVARAFQESDVSSVVLLSLDGLRRTTGFEAASATPSERLLVLRPSVARAADSNFVAQEQTPAFVAEERNLRQPTAIERSNTPAVQ